MLCVKTLIGYEEIQCSCIMLTLLRGLLRAYALWHAMSADPRRWYLGPRAASGASGQRGLEPKLGRAGCATRLKDR